MGNVLVINATIFENRVALVEDGTIAEYYVERKREKGIVGNIYKGRVVRVLPGMQAAFVDLGVDKAGFLYVNDVSYDPSFSEEAFDLTEGEWGGGELPDEAREQIEAVYGQGPEVFGEAERDGDGQAQAGTGQEEAGPPTSDATGRTEPLVGSEAGAAQEVAGEAPVEAAEGAEEVVETAGGEEMSSEEGPPEAGTGQEAGDATPEMPLADPEQEVSGQQGEPERVAAAPEAAAPAAEEGAESEERAVADDETSREDLAAGTEESTGDGPDEDGERAEGSLPPEDREDDEGSEEDDDSDEEGAEEGEYDEYDEDADVDEDGSEDEETALAEESGQEEQAAGQAELAASGDGGAASVPAQSRDDRGRRGRRRNKRRGAVHQRSERATEARKERARRPVKRSEIQDLLKEGDEIVVQVAKAPIGSKGARITTHVSLPGRHLVFMPTVDHVGISRRIASDKERRRLRQIIEDIRPPGTGFIVRTVADGVDREKLVADARFLLNLWADINKRKERITAPALLHPDLDLVLRATRDLFGEEVERLIIDDEKEYQRLLDFMDVHMPALKEKVEHYSGKEPIFDAYGIEDEMRRAQQRRVWLKSGGYLVIDQTEALTSIDVNSGRYIGKKNLEETIVKINIEAAEEVVYQLRLRNIGGIIILDFIDMEKSSNREKVYRALEEALRKDKAKTNILKISELGLVEMTRKRVRESLTRMMNEPCPYCDGRGMMKTTISVAYEVLRDAMREAAHRREDTLFVNCSPEVASLLTTVERDALRYTMERSKKKLVMKAQEGYHREQYDLYAKNTETGTSVALGEGGNDNRSRAKRPGKNEQQASNTQNGESKTKQASSGPGSSSSRRRRRRRGRSRRDTGRADASAREEQSRSEEGGREPEGQGGSAGTSGSSEE